jgi:mannose-6-phosphate isomerase-like protein (cupin superfamily)
MKATVPETFARIPLHHAASVRVTTSRWPQGEPFAVAFAHGTMSVELYAPRGRDEQTPHSRDELYVIVSGRGDFLHGERRETFAPGDVFFVPAREEHRFENFSGDFAAWVVFYGPQGGEKS